MKRPETVESGTSTGGVFSDESWVKKFPTIADYLASDVWDDGTSRVQSKLSIGYGDGAVQLALNDVELGQSCYTTGPTVQRCLELLESALASGRIGWRRWKETGGKKRR